MTNGNPQQQLSCIVNARDRACTACGQMAVITLEWYTNIMIGPVTMLTPAQRNSGETPVVGLEMFTLCLYCLRREKHMPVWEGNLPRWRSAEILPGVLKDTP